MKILKAVAAMTAMTICSVSVFPDVSAQSNIPVVSLNAAYGSEESVTEVSLNIDGDISAYSAEVNFDPHVLYFIGAQQAKGIDGGTFYCNDTISDDSIRLVWSDSRNQSCEGAVAILYFKAAYGTAETDTQLSIGRVQLADDMLEAKCETKDCTMKIAGKITKGDVNGDGAVNVSDVVRINLYILNDSLYDLSYTLQANADVTEDGIVNAIDSSAIMNYVAMVTKEL